MDIRFKIKDQEAKIAVEAINALVKVRADKSIGATHDAAVASPKMIQLLISWAEERNAKENQ